MERLLSTEEMHDLTDALLVETRGKLDGSGRNILVPSCPFCGHDGYKFGIFVGKPSGARKFGSSHCFRCGKSCRTLEDTLRIVGHPELLPSETLDLQADAALNLFGGADDECFDEELVEVSLPEYYSRTYKNRYLKERGWCVDDYEYFPVGTTRGLNWRYDNYVVFPVIMDGMTAGYVGRHTWSKDAIDSHNESHRYKIRRYINSSGEGSNGFGRLLYNYDMIEPCVTDTVVLCEGIFDVVGLTRGMMLYDNRRIVPVATFGKKISREQMFRLQDKGVKNVVIGYDNDDAASDSLRSVADTLDPYFDVFVLKYPPGAAKDFGDMGWQDMYDVFADNLITLRQMFIL